MNKVEFFPQDVKYYVNKEKGIVVATIEHTRNMFINFFKTSKAPQLTISFDKVYDYFEMPNHFSAKATCSKDDDFDIELGKLIAYQRLREKITKSFFKRMTKYVNLLDEERDKFIDTYNNYINKVEQNEQYRESIINNALGDKPE